MTDLFDNAQTGVVSAPVGLGIDIGTTNTKVAVVRMRRSAVELAAVASAPTPSAADLAPTLHRLTAKALADAGQPVPDAVGIASMAETGVPLGDDGAPLGDWLRWDGHRATDEAAALAARLGRTALFEATGVRPSAKVPLATLAWLAAHDAGRHVAMRRWAGVADLACRHLTGELVTDHTLAGRTMAYRLPPAGSPLPEDFDAALLAEVGLRPGVMPRVAGPGAFAGAVRGSRWTDAGLRPGTPVAVAGHDHAVGAWAAGVREPGDVADSLGTAEALYAVLGTDPARSDVAAAGMSLVRTVEGRPALLAGSSSAGAMVRWWLEHEAPGLSAEDLFAQVEALPASERPSDVFVLPYVTGRQTPEPDPSARVRVVGSRDGLGSTRLAAAMVDGLCLQAAWMLDEQVRIAGGRLRPRELVVLGGPAAASPAWMRAKARLTPVPLRLVDCAEPVAAGAALLALSRAGAFLHDAVPTLPRASGPLPDADPNAAESLARFVAAARASAHPHHGSPLTTAPTSAEESLP